MKLNNFGIFSLLIFFVLSSCSINKATRTIYKGSIGNTKKVLVTYGEIGGMKYVHAHRFIIGNNKYEYWIYLNGIPINKDSVEYSLERSFYKGNKYMYTSIASLILCNSSNLHGSVLPEEIEILKFISQHLKESNYRNRVTESSIEKLKYWCPIR
jgi:hypothetical protein